MASPGPAFCQRQQELLLAFSQAVAEYHRIHSAHVAAVLKGDPDLLEAELKATNRRRNQAKDAVVDHRRTHGC